MNLRPPRATRPRSPGRSFIGCEGRRIIAASAGDRVSETKAEIIVVEEMVSANWR